MKAWEGWTGDEAYGLRMEVAALRKIDRFCRAAGDIETGGILIGYYSHDLRVAVVCEATPPPSDSARGPTLFRRGVAGLRELLASRWRARRRTYYLGEWHFHPSRWIVPSSVDFSQMLQISRAAAYRCSEPILVIAGADTHHGDRVLRAFVCPVGGSPTELLTSAGDPALGQDATRAEIRH